MKHLKLWIKILVLLSVLASPAISMVETGQAAGLPNTTAASTPITLIITNPLPKDTTVNLSGTKAYTIFVPKGATITKTIEPGNYKFSYAGCLGKTKKGNLKVKKSAATLKVPGCKMATWAFYNADDGVPASLTLKGWVNYTVVIPPGEIKVFSWVADTYSVTARACGKSFDYTWKVKGKKRWIIFACN